MKQIQLSIRLFTNMKWLAGIVSISCFLFIVACQPQENNCEEIPSVSVEEDSLQNTPASNIHLIQDYEALSANGLVNVVIEIPSGTNEKWEVSKEDGQLQQDEEDGKPRVISYLSYPGNYGFVPSTLLNKADGGDGDPLDVLVLGPAIEQGTVAECKLIGVLKLLDNGEQDDKLIGVSEHTAFYHLQSIEELDNEFKGVSLIIETWFTNYKGPGEMESLGFSGSEEAQNILDKAIASYSSQNN